MKRSKAHKQAIRKICEHYEKPEVKAFYAGLSEWPNLQGIKYDDFEASLRNALFAKSWWEPLPDPIDWSYTITIPENP